MRAARVAGEEVVDHVGAEALAQVEREVREAHRVRQRARAVTACGEQQLLLAVVRRVRPQLERHGDDVVARVERELGGGGAVDPAAHRHQRAA